MEGAGLLTEYPPVLVQGKSFSHAGRSGRIDSGLLESEPGLKHLAGFAKSPDLRIGGRDRIDLFQRGRLRSRREGQIQGFWPIAKSRIGRGARFQANWI